MPPPGAPFRALHPYQFAPAEYNPLMPSPDHPPNAPHLMSRVDHSGASDLRDRNHSPYYSHPPPHHLHASSSRAQYQSPPSPQFRTHAVNWAAHPPSSSQQQQQQQLLPPPSALAGPSMPNSFSQANNTPRGRSADDSQRAPQAAMLYAQSQQLPPIQSNSIAPPATRGRSSSLIAASAYPQGGNVPRLPPIMQVEKQQVTTSATQAASASRRRNEANFVCPVPGCGSTFTRRFNLRVRSDGGADCRQATEAANIAQRLSPQEDEWENGSNSTERSTERGSRRVANISPAVSSQQQQQQQPCMISNPHLGVPRPRLRALAVYM
ncbi:hypothetical protein TRAPUB_13058 [Trametes pubescens]|uniref:Uncharacterized protein n=1 Tax=Trametes pubescens TaxID=154538 RepID=A0A1M2VS65_TRAPU|nr:hypothetical protein TRAPUB_13058 [Trametes pubescens]